MSTNGAGCAIGLVIVTLASGGAGTAIACGGANTPSDASVVPQRTAAFAVIVPRWGARNRASHFILGTSPIRVSILLLFVEDKGVF